MLPLAKFGTIFVSKSINMGAGEAEGWKWIVTHGGVGKMQDTKVILKINK